MPIIKWGHETEVIPVDWLWKPLIPYSKVTIIEGDGGDGKTTMILTIAAMLSKGIQPPSLVRGHLIDEPDCDPITTFYLTNEDDAADTSSVRFLRAGGDSHRFAYSAELQEHMTMTEDNLLSAIEQSQCRLLIIDPFQAFLPDGTSMGSITRMRSVFTTLANIAKRTGVAIVLVGHLNKSEGSKDIHRGFGSADIAAAVRSILMVQMSKRDRENRWVKTIKSNFDESDYTPIRLVLDDERKLSFAECPDPSDPSAADFSSSDEDENGIDDGGYERYVTKIEKAVHILTVLLADGPVPVSEINEVMEEDNIGAKTAQRAKTRIGAVQEYVDGVPVWLLPPTDVAD